MIDDIPPPTRPDADAELRYLREVLIEALANSSVVRDRDLGLLDASIEDTAEVVAHAVLDGGRYHRAGGYHIKDRAEVRVLAEAEGLIVLDPDSAGDAATLARALLRGFRWDWK